MHVHAGFRPLAASGLAVHCTFPRKAYSSALEAAMSWAKIVQAQPAEKVATVPKAHLESGSTAVVDTNAIIAGVQLHTLAEQVVTVPEVLAELRDAKLRQALDALPCRLHTREPSEESLAAGALSYRTPS